MWRRRRQMVCLGVFCVRVTSGELWLGANSNETQAQFASRVVLRAQREPSLAIVVRGLLYLEHRTPLSSGRKVIKDFLHDASQRALPSVLRFADRARQRCRLYTEVFVATTEKPFPAAFLERLNVSAVLLFRPEQNRTVEEGMSSTQFGLASAALTMLAPMLAAFDLVLVTRDDYVYAPWAFDVFATRFDPAPNLINLVNTDCSNHAWDGLHAFSGDEVGLYVEAFREEQRWAHMLEIPGYHKSFFFPGKFSQPDRCHHPMGFIDRTSNATDVSDGHHAWMEPGPCCANYTEQIAALDLRRHGRVCPRTRRGLTSPVGGEVVLSSARHKTKKQRRDLSHVFA